jgi:hypothetical protein
MVVLARADRAVKAFNPLLAIRISLQWRYLRLWLLALIANIAFTIVLVAVDTAQGPLPIMYPLYTLIELVGIVCMANIFSFLDTKAFGL